VLARNTTWTMERETKLPLRFVGVSYHDGQGFIVKKLLGVTSALQLSGAAICFLSGTTTEANVADFFREKEMAYTPVVFATLDELVAGFDAGKCDTYTADVSQLYAVRLRLGNPDDAMVLPDVISKEPLGPAVRQGDEQWFTIVRWVLFALINAEELEVTQANAAALKADSKNPAVRRLLGPRRRLGGAHAHGHGKLRRDFRAQSGAGNAARHQPRPQRIVEPGRPALRPAGQVSQGPVATGVSGLPPHSVHEPS
jgi:general L-amino acid transport system substrate-binding protein